MGQRNDIKISNGDRIRSMTDEELVEKIYELPWNGEFCENRPECQVLLNTDEGIPEGNCKQCLLRWLRSPAKELQR